jgi:hypothetical protein
MDLINYGYSSSEDEKSPSREETSPVRSSNGQNNDDEGASSSNDMEIEVSYTYSIEIIYV